MSQLPLACFLPRLEFPLRTKSRCTGSTRSHPAQSYVGRTWTPPCSLDDLVMEPPSYEEASLQPPAPYPPPSYHTSQSVPPMPPPSYGEAVQPDPFPVLIPPVVPAAVAPTPQNPRTIIHPMAQIGVMPPATVVQVTVSQPQPVPVRPMCLTNIPALVQCPHCQRTNVTKVKRVPGMNAWCMCGLLALLGLICGCCLIPLMIPSLQETRHFCPHCQAHLHTYIR